MLKKRISANLIIKDGIVVQSLNFKKYLPVGSPAIAVEFLNQWGIDEIILLDISASAKKIPPNFQMIKNVSKKCYVPLTVGGGIKNIDEIKELMHCGADKISFNQAAIYNQNIIADTAHTFGNQCVVVSIDAIHKNGKYWVYDYIKKVPLETSIKEFSKKMEDLGAGEILINSVERDGSYAGYDYNLINKVCDVVSIPVICCGGAKNANDFIEVFNNTNVSAASAGNFFHFTEHSVIAAKANVCKTHIVRLETFATYNHAQFDIDMRIQKKNEKDLEEMLFVPIKKERI